MPRQLIVNADDLGLHAARNRGILEAVDAGVVTSVSMLVNFEDAFLDALRGLRAFPQLEVGLHLNISEGRPLLSSVPTLVDARGSFWGKEETRHRALEGMFHLTDVEREMECQAGRLRVVGLRVGHVDGHQHIHVYGRIALAVKCSTRRLEIRRIRIPSEPPELSEGLPEQRRVQIALYRRLSEERADWFPPEQVRADHFRGLALSGRMTAEALVDLVRTLPEGTTELMVHPGYATAKQGFDGPDREAELRALLDPAFKKALSDEGVELVGNRRSA